MFRLYNKVTQSVPVGKLYFYLYAVFISIPQSPFIISEISVLTSKADQK